MVKTQEDEAMASDPIAMAYNLGHHWPLGIWVYVFTHVYTVYRGARTLLGAPGLSTRSKDASHR